MTALAFRFRLYPNRKQEERMSDAVETCRRLWNLALVDRKEAWEYRRLSTTYEEQCLMLTAEKRIDPSLAAVYSQSLEDVLKRLGRAFEAFFERRAKYPRFKRFSESGSFTYPQAYNGSVKLDSARGRIFLSKVGNVRVVAHRPVPFGARMKTCTLKREPDGRWYACLVYEDDGVLPLQGVQTESWKSPVGVDRGLVSLIATSDGEKVEPPEFVRKSERRLKRLQRSLARKKKGSKNREKARRLLARQHAQVANRRGDFSHKLSAKLVRGHDLIAFEDLQVRNMTRNHSLAKSISDAGWSQLAGFVEHKMKRARKTFVKVPPQNTTQECWFCGGLNQVPLSAREFECRACGKTLDRDVNAARIVLKRGVSQVGQDRGSSSPGPDGESHHQALPELKPVETGPPLSETTRRASSVEEAGTIRGGSHTAQSETHRWKPTGSLVGGCHRILAEIVDPEGYGRLLGAGLSDKDMDADMLCTTEKVVALKGRERPTHRKADC